MHSEYLNPAIRELRDQQVRFAPREKKWEQAIQAEKLLHELDPSRTYSYEYLCYRITNFRPETSPNVNVSGREAQHDLRLFVEDVSNAANVPVEAAGEPVLTVEELTRRFNVSTKTISRWREQGLVSRRFLMEGRKRVGFLESSVNRFVAQNAVRVRRGSLFTKLTAEERELILRRARRLAAAGGAPAEVIRRVARKVGRSKETVRYIIKKFDAQYPQQAIFPNAAGPLQSEVKRKIYQWFHRGESVESLAKRFARTPATIYRILSEVRAQRIMELPLDYVPNDSFSRVRTKKQHAAILAPPPPSDAPPKKPRLPSGLPPYLKSLYEVPLLTPEQERHLFRKMNYLKYRAARLRQKLSLARPKAKLMDQIEQYYREAVETKNQIIRANLRLVVSIAKRHVGPKDNFFELVSDGNMSLMRAVEKFDYSRGNKFSTYASWAIMKNFARTIPDEHRQRDRFRTSLGEMFAATEDARSSEVAQESSQLERESQVGRMLERLDEREQKIIIKRFGLEQGSQSLTLKEVGEQLGITKERVRQIEARALSKLRKAAAESHIELHG
jgi:RNA polymerase primary sigma factor/RNA polymerase sigma factor